MKRSMRRTLRGNAVRIGFAKLVEGSFFYRRSIEISPACYLQQERVKALRDKLSMQSTWSKERPASSATLQLFAQPTP